MKELQFTMSPPSEVEERYGIVFRWTKGIFFTLLLFFSTFWGSIFYFGPLLPLLIIARFTRDLYPNMARFSLRSFRFLTDHFIGAWFTLAPSVLYLLFNQRTKMFGDCIIPGESALFIMNHRTRLDWMFLWAPLMAFKSLHQLKVILKSELKLVPGAGWGMQLINFIFLHRKWDTDKNILMKMLTHMKIIGRPTQLLLFPEGTDFGPKTKMHSDSFATKNNLPIYDYVLHPRTTGFSFCVNHMVKNRQVDAIYDLTVAYPKSVLQNEFGILTGQVPEEIHFNIRRYSLQQLSDSVDLTSEEQISEWCIERWKEKEKSLSHFYSGNNVRDKKFPSSCDSATANHLSNDNGRLSSTVLFENLYAQMLASVIFWTVSVVLQFYLFLTSPLCFYYSIVTIAIFTAATWKGGMELIESGIL